MDIQIQLLQKRYVKAMVVNIPMLTLKQGELVGLVGNNGAGKTTLMRLILDLIEPTQGFVCSNGEKVNETEAWKHYTGSFIDGRFLIELYTPEEYFQFIAAVYGIDDATLQERLAYYALLMHDEILGKKKYIRDFSQGNKQKIGIIGAMLIHPQVLILDEPFNFLDPSSQIQVSRFIKRINEELGTLVLLSSHNLNFVADISSRILLMEKGEIIQDLPNHDGSAMQALADYFGE